MTTTISLPTRDCVVIGCDSLATTSQNMINPSKFADYYFSKDGRIKLGKDNQPLLKSVKSLFAFLESIPTNQLPSVTKIFDLKPFEAGLLFAGITGIGKQSVKNLIDRFKDSSDFKSLYEINYTLEKLTEKLFKCLKKIYDIEYEELPEKYRPVMEVIVSGYSKEGIQPEVFRIILGQSPYVQEEVKAGDFNIVYGGTYDVIQRIVGGIDSRSFSNLIDRNREILDNCKRLIETKLSEAGIELDLPEIDGNDPDFDLFGKNFGGVSGIFSDIKRLSEQAAIDFVEFLISTMIKAQEFSESLPTVGGEIHIAIITKMGGFKWISKEEYKFQDNTVPKHEQ